MWGGGGYVRHEKFSKGSRPRERSIIIIRPCPLPPCPLPCLPCLPCLPAFSFPFSFPSAQALPTTKDTSLTLLLLLPPLSHRHKDAAAGVLVVSRRSVPWPLSKSPSPRPRAASCPPAFFLPSTHALLPPKHSTGPGSFYVGARHVMAAPQDALAARAGSSEMEFLVRFGLWGSRVCVWEGEGRAMRPCPSAFCSWLCCLWHIDWVGSCLNAVARIVSLGGLVMRMEEKQARGHPASRPVPSACLLFLSTPASSLHKLRKQAKRAPAHSSPPPSLLPFPNPNRPKKP